VRFSRVFAAAYPSSIYSRAFVSQPALFVYADLFVKLLTRYFTGRGDDLYRISSALRKYKIVVVHGAPGIGKSSAASVFMNFAARRCMYPGGCCLVSFKGAPSDEVIWENLAVALKISVSTGIHDTKGQSSCSNRQLVISRIANKKMLLVCLQPVPLSCIAIS
jgi:hypothetical protein